MAIRRAGLLVIFLTTFSLGSLTSLAAQSSAETHLEQKKIELEFPTDWNHATLSIYQQPVESSYVSGQLSFDFAGQTVGSALGSVAVPENSFVGISIPAAAGYDRFIHALPKSGIQRLELSGLTVDNSLLRAIEKIHSIRQLTLENCKLDFNP